MNVRRLQFWTAICSATVLAAVVPVTTAAQSVRDSNSGDPAIASCRDLKIDFDGRRAVVQVEEKMITKTEAPILRIQAGNNGGLSVVGWDQDTYAVTLCKAADPRGNAEGTLSEIHLTFLNGELGVEGPSAHDRWTAHILVSAPKSASLDLQASNGPVSLSGVEGNIKVRAQNGPLAVKSCTGNLELNAQNGPVDLEGNSGKLSVDAQNGPVTLSLQGANWKGSGIAAHANNGPLTLHIPSGYQSGVVVESDGNSPFDCRAKVCSEGRKTWGDSKKSIEFGSGPTMIHLSAMNGPISIN
jgi:hypothetical protein